MLAIRKFKIGRKLVAVGVRCDHSPSPNAVGSKVEEFNVISRFWRNYMFIETRSIIIIITPVVNESACLLDEFWLLCELHSGTAINSAQSSKC